MTMITSVGGHMWPCLGNPQSTAHRRAQPYLTAGPDEGARP
jgi:hypothetical protein